MMGKRVDIPPFLVSIHLELFFSIFGVNVYQASIMIPP